MEADDIIGAQQRQHDICVAGQGHKSLGAREWRVQEEADRCFIPIGAQLARQRNQVVVVDPDHVVGLQERSQLAREQGVDPLVAGEVAASKSDQAEPEMEQRPQHLVAVAVVILLVSRVSLRSSVA